MKEAPERPERVVTLQVLMGARLDWLVNLFILPASLDAVIHQGDEAGCNNNTIMLVERRQDAIGERNLLGNIDLRSENRLVADPHVIGRNPSARIFIIFNLIRASRLRGDVGYWLAASIAVEMEGNCVEVLVMDELPKIGVPPPLEFVPQ